jgi:hypothetical protein
MEPTMVMCLSNGCALCRSWVRYVLVKYIKQKVCMAMLTACCICLLQFRECFFFSIDNIMALDIHGKTALVTGGGSGICLDVSRLLLDGGCNVVIADLALRPEAKELTENTKSANGARASFIETDVTKWDQLQNSFDHAIKTFGQLDIVVPGAGLFEPPVGPLPRLDNILSLTTYREYPIFGIQTREQIQWHHLPSKCSMSMLHTLSVQHN